MSAMQMAAGVDLRSKTAVVCALSESLCAI